MADNDWRRGIRWILTVCEVLIAIVGLYMFFKGGFRAHVFKGLGIDLDRLNKVDPVAQLIVGGVLIQIALMGRLQALYRRDRDRR
jgi:hypothetical protein